MGGGGVGGGRRDGRFWSVGAIRFFPTDIKQGRYFLMPLTIPCSWRQVSCGCVPQCTLESKHRTQMAQVTAKIWFMIIGLVSFVLGSIFLTAYFLSPGPPNPSSINNDYGDQMHSNTYPDRQLHCRLGPCWWDLEGSFFFVRLVHFCKLIVAHDSYYSD